MAKITIKQQVYDLIMELNDGLVALPMKLQEVSWNRFNVLQEELPLLKADQPIQHIFWLLNGIRTGIRYYKGDK